MTSNLYKTIVIESFCCVSLPAKHEACLKIQNSAKNRAVWSILAHLNTVVMNVTRNVGYLNFFLIFINSI